MFALSSKLAKTYCIASLAIAAAFFAVFYAEYGAPVPYAARIELTYAVAAVASILCGTLAFSDWRLRRIRAELRTGGAVFRLRRLPKETFAVAFASGAVVSAAYHGARKTAFGTSETFDWLRLWIDLAFVASVALVYFAAAEATLEPLYKRLSRSAPREGEPRSFVPLWTTMFCATLLTAVLAQLGYTMASYAGGGEPSIAAYVCIAAFAMLLGGWLLKTVFAEFRSGVASVRAAIRDFTSEERLLADIRLPITTPRELGELASSFNALQETSRQLHQELEEDLRLAVNVRRLVLPVPSGSFGPFRVAFPKEKDGVIDGTFYDSIALADGRIALAIGAVAEKGLPAALLMSAAVMLLRAELGEGGSSREALARMDEALIRTAGEGAGVSLALAIVDPIRRVVDVSLAGRAEVIARRRERTRVVLSSDSRPLGLAPNVDRVGTSKMITVGRGERLTFCLDDPDRRMTLECSTSDGEGEDRG